MTWSNKFMYIMQLILNKRNRLSMISSEATRVSRLRLHLQNKLEGTASPYIILQRQSPRCDAALGRHERNK